MKFFYFLLISLLATFSSLPADESVAFPNTDPVHVTLVSEEKTVQPGHQFWLGVRVKVDDNLHVYWKNPGDAGFPISIEWVLPEGFKAGDIEWPTPERLEIGSSLAYGYEKEVMLLVPITPPGIIKDIGDVKIFATVRWLACSDKHCLPGDSEISLTLPWNKEKPALNSSVSNEFANVRKTLPEKEWDITVAKNNEKINLTLKSQGKPLADFNSAVFLPEENGVIDTKQKLTLQKASGDSNSYTVSIPTTGPHLPAMLKGILVLKDSNRPTSMQSLAIQAPLEQNNSATSPAQQNENSQEIAPPLPQFEWTGGIGMALLFAFLGGAILNLMPCVLPVISLKVLSFVKMSGQNKSETIKHGVAFTMGVLVSFWALAGLLMILQAYGRSVGWGFQLQEPIFVAILAAVLFVLSLSLFGVFEVGTMMSSWAGQAESDTMTKSSGLLASFSSGILATAVATPCTGPFLGSALGFAVTLSPLLSLLIFTALGLGMASPYLLLALFPGLLRFLPKPGKWMVTFKQIMGFLMIATVFWLLWVFVAQTSELALMKLLGSFLLISFAAWLYGKWGTPFQKRSTRAMSTVFAAIFVIMSIIVIKDAIEAPASEAIAEAQAGWEPFSPERVAELRKNGTPILIDFTARWCLICQTNHLVFRVPEVDKKMEQLGVVKLLADWTKNDPMITQALKEFGRSGVPLYLLYGADESKPPEVLPQVLTVDAMLDSLEKIELEKKNSSKNISDHAH